MRKKIVIPLVILCSTALLLWLASSYMLHYSLHHDHSHYDTEASWAQVVERYPHIASWSDSIRSTGALRDSFILGDKGQRIHLYWLPAQRPTHRTALLLHGYKNDALHMMHIGYMYHHDLGYNIVLFDQYGHGLSEGDIVQMGWLDRHNALACIKLVEKGELPTITNSTDAEKAVVVHGISMGAATAMMLSGEENLPHCVKAFVEDCGYTSVWDEFSGELKARFALPEVPLLYTSSLLCRLRYGWSFGQASALQQVQRCTHPMLFIHGDADTFVPTQMVYTLHAAHRGPKALWIVPHTVHAQSYYNFKEEYTHRVDSFLQRHL